MRDNSDTLAQATTYGAELLEDFKTEALAKYLKGHMEHVENAGIWTMTAEELLEAAIEESIDHVIYLYTLRRKIRNVVAGTIDY